MTRVNPILPHDYNFEEVNRYAPEQGDAPIKPAVDDATPASETTNDVCDHEHSFACFSGEGWNSGCCGKPHGRVPILLRMTLLVDRDPDAGFERTE